MTTFIPDRDFAFTILKEYTRNESLIRHALTAEAVMRYFAELFSEKEVDKWGLSDFYTTSTTKNMQISIALW